MTFLYSGVMTLKIIGVVPPMVFPFPQMLLAKPYAAPAFAPNSILEQAYGLSAQDHELMCLRSLKIDNEHGRVRSRAPAA